VTLILGVDPGYANLGLAVVDVAQGKGEGSLRRLLFSKSISVGSASSPMRFADRLHPELDKIWATYGPFKGVGAESPTLIMRRVRTTALIWHVTGIVTAWAKDKNIPFKHLHPISLKRVAMRCLDIPLSSKKYPKKREIKELVATWIGEGNRTSHENDAILAAVACYGLKAGTVV
jgi:Holliday junction resolvasome RuvABC endonuclease subunit|tara:strand:+ start:439 stop:963 length:525 start_codon:yes stop_codon:yes gene_type:complete